MHLVIILKTSNHKTILR
ncbi:dolichyl-diphosphooligosaccharide--protein glycosyltransferase subunitSTT3A, partial [Trichinella spiralis]